MRKDGDLHAQFVAFQALLAYLASDDTDSQSGNILDDMSKFLVRHRDQADLVKLGLIQLLSKANYYFIESKNPPSDPYLDDDISEHYAELIDIVSSIDDERTIPALVGAMTTGGMAERGILKYGNKALSPVLNQLSSADPLVRSVALKLSVTMLRGKSDAASYEQAVGLVRRCLEDPGSVVRSQAIREIDCLPSRQDFVPALERLAKSDPDHFLGRADDGIDGDEFYPVRFQARRVLLDIQNSKVCKPQPR